MYCDHHTADEHVAHVPMILRWPSLGANGRGRVHRALHYQFDVAATVLELLGGEAPSGWDAAGFGAELRAGRDVGRDHLVVTQGAWTCQRAVRFDDRLCIRTTHDGYHGFPEVMLFDVARDPHETRDLTAQEPETVRRALSLLDAWRARVLGADAAVDPLDTVMREGGPFHVRGKLPAYLERLRATGRASWAERLAAAHALESRNTI